MIKKIIKKILLKNNQQDFTYLVGEYNLLFPFDHLLPQYQKAYRFYDKKIGLITRIINHKNKSGFIIDIGANIGDTAALIRSNCDLPLFCIEGDPRYLSYLFENTKQIKNVEIYAGFVGEDNKTANLSINHYSGTAQLIENSSNNLQLKNLETILLETQKKASDIRLLKIDTDGYDFAILLSISSLLKINKLNLFFEYDLSFNDNADMQAEKVIAFLDDTNYKLIIYDNFGNFMMPLENNLTAQMDYLNRYLKSSRIYGGGVYYYDIFATTDTNLFNEIIETENNLIIKKI
jgi:FkbM family methyltransferase